MLHKSKLMLPILAVIVGIAASAFTTDHPAKAGTTYFQYAGSSDAGYTVASNWVASQQPLDGCVGTVKTCTVRSETISTSSDLANYLTSHDPQSDHGDDYIIESKEPNFSN